MHSNLYWLANLNNAVSNSAIVFTSTHCLNLCNFVVFMQIDKDKLGAGVA